MIKLSSLTTKKAIANSFKELLVKQPFNKITINDIAKNCDINRQTFYYHFEDIVDLVEWIWTEKVDKVLENKTEYKSWQEKFLAVFKFMEQERILILNMYKSVSVEILRKSLYRLVYPIIYEEVKEQSKGKKIKEEDIKFITNFYKYAFVSIVISWVDKNMEEDPKIIVNKVSNLVTGTINHACNAY